MKVIMGCIEGFLIVIFLTTLIACNFAPVSYPYREEYEINAPESIAIEAIQNFKKDNPQYIVPEHTQLTDGRNNEAGQDYWYHIYIFTMKRKIE